IACQCMSINPGIRVRPPPLIMRVLLVGSTGIGAVEIFSILLPRTRTLVGPESPADLPSNTRTSLKSTLGCESCAGAADTNQPKINRDRTTSLLNGVANRRRGSKAPLFIRHYFPSYNSRSFFRLALESCVVNESEGL